MPGILIIDDEESACKTLATMIGLCSDYKDAPLTVNCIADAVIAIRQHNPDLVLLDIEMGNEKGFDLFGHFPDPGFKVIFITAHEQYALQAFRFSALGYVLKPVDPDHLARALEKATKAVDNERLALRIGSFLENIAVPAKGSKKIVLKTTGSMHVVALHDIMYCEADHSYTTFYLEDKTHIMVSRPIGEYEELLSGFNFIRIHQSYLLNIDHLKRFDKNEGGSAVLKDNTSLPVASRKKEALLQLLNKL